MTLMTIQTSDWEALGWKVLMTVDERYKNNTDGFQDLHT